jgi:medium-chain acyl-[acyl-carrier-protein] hydrolase
MKTNGPTAVDLSWFEDVSPARTALLRVFCLPYAGASADLYRAWQSFIPPEVDLCLVHLPGRSRRIAEKPFQRLALLVDAVTRHMDSKTDIPYALYGHSMGGLISFELARELFRRYKSGPRHLFVSGCLPPHLMNSGRSTFALSDSEFIAELEQLKGTPAEILDNAELMEIFLPLLRADFELVETYECRSGVRLACPITVYSGLNDERVPPQRTRCWEEHTSAGCTVRLLHGDHFFINAGQEFVNIFRDDLLGLLQDSTLERSPM